MLYGVTAATGHLGRLVVQALLDSGVARDDVVAIVRDPARAADLGVPVRQADYDDPEGLRAALEGVGSLLVISGSEPGNRVRQHANVAEAAKAAGVGRITYTSAPSADALPEGAYFFAEHTGSEQAIRETGLPFTFLRNGWYVENYTAQLPTYLEHGIAGATGEGRIAAAPRRDFAAAAAAVLTGEGHEGRVYELGGDESFTLAELAEAVSEAAGRPVPYKDLPAGELAAVLTGAGLPEPVAKALADADTAIAAGWLDITTGDLARLIGRPTTPWRDEVRAAVSGS